MRILLYCKPTLEARAFHNSPHWVWLGHQLAQVFLKEGHDVSLCLNSYQLGCWTRLKQPLLNELSEKIIVDFPSDITPGRFTADHFLAASDLDTDLTKLLDFFASRIADRDFDCVISIGDRGVLPRLTIKKALHFSFVEAAFTRWPYPRLWALDPHGIDKSDAFHSDRSSEYLASITDDEIAGARSFAEDMARKLRRRQVSELSHGRLRKQNVLVALQKEGVSALDVHTPYGSQLEFLLDVLERLPRDVGAVVTEHPQYPVIEKSAFLYLRENYPNLLFYPKWMAVEGISQSLLSVVDAAVVQTSTVGIQSSLIFGLPTLSVSPGSRVGPFVGGHDINLLQSISEIPTISDELRFRLLAFQLFRYSYSDESAFESNVLVKAVEAAVTAGDASEVLGSNYDLRRSRLNKAIAKTEAEPGKSRPFDKIVHLPGAPIALIEGFEAYNKKILAKIAPPKAHSSPKPATPPGRDTVKWKILYSLEKNVPASIVKPAEKVLKKWGVI